MGQQVSDHLIEQQLKRNPTKNYRQCILKKGNRFLFIEHMDTKSGEMNNLLLFEKSSNPFPRLVTAKKAMERKNWFLYNGFIHERNFWGH